MSFTPIVTTGAPSSARQLKNGTGTTVNTATPGQVAIDGAGGSGGGQSWNFYRENGSLWQQWGKEEPDNNFEGTAKTVVSVAGIQDQLRAQPTIFARAGTLDNLMIPMVISGVADQRLWVAIYDSDPDTLYPVNRLWDSGSLLINVTASGGATIIGYMLSPALAITNPGFYYFVWTCNSAFGLVPANQFMYDSQSAANTTIPWLGVPDRGWTDGFNNVTAVTIAALQRGGCQWVIPSTPFAQPPNPFPGTPSTTGIADGSTVGLSYAGAQQLKGGGAPLTVMYRFSHA